MWKRLISFIHSIDIRIGCSKFNGTWLIFIEPAKLPWTNRSISSSVFHTSNRSRIFEAFMRRRYSHQINKHRSFWLTLHVLRPSQWTLGNHSFIIHSAEYRNHTWIRTYVRSFIIELMFRATRYRLTWSRALVGDISLRSHINARSQTPAVRNVFSIVASAPDLHFFIFNFQFRSVSIQGCLFDEWHQQSIGTRQSTSSGIWTHVPGWATARSGRI